MICNNDYDLSLNKIHFLVSYAVTHSSSILFSSAQSKYRILNTNHHQVARWLMCETFTYLFHMCHHFLTKESRIHTSAKMNFGYLLRARTDHDVGLLSPSWSEIFYYDDNSHQREFFNFQFARYMVIMNNINVF